MAIKTKDNIIEEILQSITRLDGWITVNGWAGYDPYDVRGHPLVLKLSCNRNQNRASRLIKGGLLLTIEAFPRASRRLLRVRKETNAKAMGLFASAYLKLYEHVKEEAYLKKAYECLKWLEENKSEGYAGDCWGYPFDWQTLVLIPKRTPSAVVSSICGDAFWDFYEFIGDKKYLDVCQSICQFLINSLNIDYVDDNRICFSYTPIDRFHVHNANLFAAEFLIRVGKESNNEEFYQHGIKALNYSLNAQNKDGSFYYWALSEKDIYNISDSTLKNIDHYHTGFVLRSLYSIHKSTGDKRVLEALSKGYQLYRDRLFADKRVPKLKPDSTYPINVHSCAEAVLCMSTLSNVFPDALEYAQNAFLWAKENMQTKEGWFIYMILNIGGGRRKVKIPYIRWGQAWMMRAMSQCYSSIKAQ
jgi:rhamnogalacturonyl hydrolase YesR